MFTKLLFPNYKIGRWTYGSPKVLSWGEGATLEIGAFCSIAKGVKIFLGGEHRTDWITTYPFGVVWKRNEIKGHPSTKGDVVIGNDVWLGEDCTILSGVKIGDGAVVGTGAIVVQDVPPYAIVFGNPARVMRYRFDKNTIESLLEIQWWNWSDEKITDNLPLLSNSDIGKFIKKAIEP
jgi:acetyltransferase-like isoleucine patch superfamily enzyme